MNNARNSAQYQLSQQAAERWAQLDAVAQQRSEAVREPRSRRLLRLVLAKLA